jgi:hypothetical protein
MFSKALVLATVSSVALGACKRGYYKAGDELDLEEFQIMEFEACEGYMGGGQAYSYVYECGKDPNNSTDNNTYVWDMGYNNYECNGNVNHTYRDGAIGDLNDTNWVAQMKERFGEYFSLYDETQTSCGGDQCWVMYEQGSSTPYFNASSCDNTAYYYREWQPIGECYYGQQYTCTSTSFSFGNCTGNTAVTVVDEGCYTMNENTTDESSNTVEILYCDSSEFVFPSTTTTTTKIPDETDDAWAQNVIVAALAALFAAVYYN